MSVGVALETQAMGAAVPLQNRPSAAQVVAKLLRASLEKMHSDRDAAKLFITKACTVLESGENCEALDDLTVGFSRGGLVPWQIKRVKAFVDTNLEKPITIRELADMVRLGSSHFQRAFKASFGVSPHLYLVERRIQRAKELMLASDDPLCEIALASGFSDQSHLTTRFHRSVGITPGLWRRENRGERANNATELKDAA
jgi:AraC family transcriptional regulator